MARQREDVIYRPDPNAREHYDKLHPLYRSLTNGGGSVAEGMRRLRSLAMT